MSTTSQAGRGRARGLVERIQRALAGARRPAGDIEDSASNEGTLVTAITQPGATGLFAAADPLTPARLRGLQARDEILAARSAARRSARSSTSLDRLRRGDLDPVLRAARMFGEQGAA